MFQVVFDERFSCKHFPIYAEVKFLKKSTTLDDASIYSSQSSDPLNYFILIHRGKMKFYIEIIGISFLRLCFPRTWQNALSDYHVVKYKVPATYLFALIEVAINMLLGFIIKT